MDNMTVYRAHGQSVTLLGRTPLKMGQVVYIGEREAVGEVVSLDRDKTEIRLLGVSDGIRMGDKVRAGEEQRSILFCPGYVGGVYDALLRPVFGCQRKRYAVEMTAREDDVLSEGQDLANIKETDSFIFKALVPRGMSGRVISLEKSGEYPSDYTLVILKDDGGALHEISMSESIRVGKAPFKASCDIDSADLVIFVKTECRDNDLVAFLQRLRECDEGGGRLIDKSIVIRDTALLREVALNTAATLAQCYENMGYRISVMAEDGI